jgi:hypothetical protein
VQGCRAEDCWTTKNQSWSCQKCRSLVKQKACERTLLSHEGEKTRYERLKRIMPASDGVTINATGGLPEANGGEVATSGGEEDATDPGGSGNSASSCCTVRRRSFCSSKAFCWCCSWEPLRPGANAIGRAVRSLRRRCGYTTGAELSWKCYGRWIAGNKEMVDRCTFEAPRGTPLPRATVTSGLIDGREQHPCEGRPV